MKLRRLIAAGLASVMTVAALAGCGNSSNGGDKQTSSDGGGAQTEGSDAGNGEMVDLKWVLIGNGMPTNYDTWMAKVNEQIADIGVNLVVEVVSWSDWDSRRNVIISTNEPYDIIFGHGGNYISDINLGAYCDITDLIEANMPELNEMMPEECWTAMRVNDRIYGVPTYKDIAISNYAIWDKELVEEYNLDLASLTELESLTPVFEQLKADKNDYPFYSKNDGIYFIFDAYDQLGAGTQVLGVRYDDKDAKVCFTLEQPDVFKALQTVYEWNQKGLINPDAATLSEARVYNMWRIGQGWASAAFTSWGPQMGKDVAVEKVGDTILSNDTVRGSINMISTNSKYPEKCLQLLNKVNTDTKLRDMFYYGEEGVNFEYNEDGKVHKLDKQWDIPGYTNGTYFTVTQEDKDEYNQFEEIKELMDEAVSSVMLGFTFDTTNVYDQIANCSEIWLRYKSEVMTGVQDPTVYVPQIKEELMAAGFQDILDEAQAQVDEFMAAK